MSKGQFWETLKDVEGKQTYGPHKWAHVKCWSWSYCPRCGLIALNNWITVKAARKLCDG